MKTLKKILLKSVFILGVTCCSLNYVVARDGDPKPDTPGIKSQLDNKSWTFVAQSASPLTGRTIHLNGLNELVVKNDSIDSYLPYFGRVFSAPMTPFEGGYNFSAPIKTYSVTSRKKNGYDVQLSPMDRSNGEKFNLSVFDNGSAMLTVTNNNRQPISFNGYLRTNR